MLTRLTYHHFCANTFKDAINDYRSSMLAQLDTRPSAKLWNDVINLPANVEILKNVYRMKDLRLIKPTHVSRLVWLLENVDASQHATINKYCYICAVDNDDINDLIWLLYNTYSNNANKE